ncbi:MAG: hypothetical protein KatS3mg105_0960 [Gemmatales bacterium]|nr:MAG: hypothetical protein KatS3mg105_0960 [Gemmatales bacterium]
MPVRRHLVCFAVTLSIAGGFADAEDLKSIDVASWLKKTDTNVLSEAARKQAAGMIDRDLRRRRDRANEQNRRDWYAIKNRQQWEKFRDVRIENLRESLADFPPTPKKVNVHVSSVVKGDGYRIENLVYESRPGSWVPANLYVPARPGKSMPGILIAHSHHRDKWQGELQDMGMTWARAGCCVLIIDQVGYGERRSHPFNGPDDYDKDYPVSRQDYYFRYDTGIQLQLAGDSLMGWMVWDWMRGVDVLLDRKGIDPKRIIMLGGVAGGGDPCGITCALDKRIDCAVPFNFGGPQPETVFPLPDDAETSFNYVMGSYWDSTRGLRLTVPGGFFHWVIVASIAPRKLIHAHEFSWDKERDPVWKRYQKIWGEFYNKPENLAYAHGKGLLRQRPPQASHCGNIGRFHRRMIHPQFKKWYGIDVTEDDEYSLRRDPSDLVALPPKMREALNPKSFVELVSELGHRRAEAARKKLATLPLDQRRRQLIDKWKELLGNVEPAQAPKVASTASDTNADKTLEINRYVLEVEPDIVVPVILMTGKEFRRARTKRIVVAVAQEGKEKFAAERSEDLARLVEAGWCVCLPDVRGTGETKAGTSRGRTSSDGNRSVNMLMFGETILGQRLRDLRSVLLFLRKEFGNDAKISLWGDSFAPTNSANTNFKVPHGVAGQPKQSEPLGGLLALLGALFDGKIEAVVVRGGLSSYESVLSSYRVLIPHDVVVPEVLTAGDLCDVAGALAPTPVRLESLVDGLNRLLDVEQTQSAYAPAISSYQKAGAKGSLVFAEEGSSAAWLLKNKRK